LKIGITMFATDLAMSPIELACEAEARGFHSLYIPEHTHIPTSPPHAAADRRRGARRGVQAHARSLHRARGCGVGAPSGSCSARGSGSSRSTTRSRLRRSSRRSTCFSNGRLVLGIGYGWNHEEMENHGVDVKRRREVVRETMLAMQALWTQEVASFSGEFVRFEPSWQWPKPVQQPRPRVLLGRRAGPDPVPAHRGVRRRLAPDRRGRARRCARAAARGVLGGRPRPRVAPRRADGSLPSAEKLAYYREHGVTESVLRVPSAPRDVVMPVLDRFASEYL
jgi:hypothetical protein